jgi:hypothetical protein
MSTLTTLEQTERNLKAMHSHMGQSIASLAYLLVDLRRTSPNTGLGDFRDGRHFGFKSALATLLTQVRWMSAENKASVIAAARKLMRQMIDLEQRVAAKKANEKVEVAA